METYKLPNYRMIKVTFLGATDTLGSRIKLTETKRYNDDKTESKVFSYDYSVGNVEQQAMNILTKNGWNVICRASDLDNYVLLCDNWSDEYKHIKDLK